MDPKPTGHVFPSTRRGKCMSRPRLQPIGEDAEIPPFRSHDLRATAATKMDEFGVIRQHISLVLNHVEGGITAGYVRHDKRKHKRAALELWATELMAILDGKGRPTIRLRSWSLGAEAHPRRLVYDLGFGATPPRKCHVAALYRQTLLRRRCPPAAWPAAARRSACRSA